MAAATPRPAIVAGLRSSPATSRTRSIPRSCGGCASSCKFPFPDAQQRELIWRGIFPAATPLEGVDCAKLARLNVAGGGIRNIAMNAAFLAAAAGSPVAMPHLLQAARSEAAKRERALSDAETRGWV